MNRVHKLRNMPETERALPCEYFDLICGTSTGGFDSMSAYEEGGVKTDYMAA